MKIIDGHMHTKYFPENWFIECADKRGYEAYAVLSLSSMKSWGGALNNEHCIAVKRADPKRAYFFAGLEHPCEDYAAHVRKWLGKGADGIKFIETKPTVFKETGVDLSDAQFDAMFDYLEKTETPILWHVGDPASFWKRDEAPAFAFEHGWFYGDGGFATLQELYAIPEKVLARHPKLHICFAHLYFCGDDRAHAEWLLETYKNVRLDITAGGEMYEQFQEDLAYWHDFFMKYQDRIQLGTDTDMGEELGEHTSLELSVSALKAGPMDYYGKLFDKALDLPDEVAEKITFRNFRAFAGAAPKAL